MLFIFYAKLGNHFPLTRWRPAKGFAATTTDPIEHINEEKSLLKIFVKIVLILATFPSGAEADHQPQCPPGDPPSRQSVRDASPSSRTARLSPGL